MASQYNSRQSLRGRPPAAPSRRWSTVGQPTGKANYRPMTTSMSRRPSQQQQQRPLQQDSIQEAERSETTPTENKQLSNPVPPSKKRYSYRQPSDPKVAAEIEVLTKYMTETNLMNAMMAVCQSVLRQESLPYNPYPEFVRQIRHDAERFHMFAQTTKAIQATLTSQLQSTTTPHIYGVKGHSNAWGLEPVINAVNPQALKRYDSLIEDETPTKLVLSDEQQEYSGQILVAIVGPAAFTGTIYHEVPSVDLRVEYIIYGPDVQTALLIFNSCISEDIRRHLSTDCPHKILGILVPKSGPNSQVTNSSEIEFWTVEQAREKWDEFWDTVRDAVLQKRPIVIQCLFLLDHENNEYRTGNKQFILHFVETSENSEKEKFRSFAELPYMTLYEGVFLKKAHAEAYVMTLKRLQDNTNQTAANRQRPDMEDSLASLHEAERDDGNDLIYAGEVREPIREKWQRQIAKLHPVRDAFRLAHLTLLLALSDSVEGSEVRIEVYRFLHSTAASFHTTTVLNSTLQLLAHTTNQKNSDDQRLLTKQFAEYKTRLLATVDPELHARSSEFHVAHTVLGKVMEQMLAPDSSDPSKLILKSLDLNTLQFIQNYCTSLQFLLIEDAMFFFKRLNFKTLVSGCREAFNRQAAGTTNGSKRKPHQGKSSKSNTSIAASTPDPVKINHGVEAKEIVQQRNIVIDVEEVKSFSNWPRIMVTEAVLMQFMVDVKLDQVWLEFLLELMTGDRLPPNPYPRLVTVLRQAAHRMQLCSETNSALSSKLLHPEQVRLVDHINTIHGVTSIGAYGLSHCSLAGLDAEPLGFVKIAKLTDKLANREVAARRGQFQIAVSQAIGKNCAFYGRLVPYINILHLYDHYYIRGNIGADGDAIQLYAKLVYDYITGVIAQNQYVVLGVYFDDSDRYMSDEDLETEKATFLSHVVDAARKKEDVYLKIYQPIGWRYLCMHKHFVLHYLFVDNTEDRHECFSPDNPSTIYQFVFLSLEEAAAHSRGGRPKQLGNIEATANMKRVSDYLNKEIEGALQEHQVVQAYELIICNALISKDKEFIANAWRVLHSVAYQLNYIQIINRDLQTLVQHALTFPKKLVRAVPSNQSLTKGRGNKTKGEAEPTSQGPFTDTTLSRFFNAYCDKLSSILQDPCAFVPSSLVEMIQEKLKTVTDINNKTSKHTLRIELETVVTLKEVYQLVQPVQDWTSFDIHQAISQHAHGNEAPQE
ncbi:uncharacterized protein LOC110985468 isoform X2 [Acanthaster planci]|uniref:Uncharacterized protein LOC110985468 isoform X2 n=1 Tax=Acanthaster planci TaxID=133434 RepID=A0A8B7ZB43_ACAPL|nr:uncharacterized protein LOC110985468 isoform X2 [Acanthaster planci]